MTKPLKILLSLIFLVQLGVITGFELAHDEAYYWLYAKNLDWGYFDHPPFVGVVIRMFSFLPHSEWAVRLGFVLLQFGTLFITLALIEKRYWTRASLLFFAFPLASLSGLLALPDVPLLFMTALYCLLLERFLRKRDLVTSVFLGITIALLLYAKYHGILLVFFTVIALPALFREPKFYLVAGIAIICFLPHLWWQYAHDFSTLRYHFLERPRSAFSWKRILEFLGVQVGMAGVFVGPAVWWSVIRTSARDNFTRSLKAISLGSVIFFLVSSLSKKFEANWTVYLAVPLLILVAGSKIWEKKWARILLLISLALVFLARFTFLVPPEILKLKRLKEFNGWENWAHDINQNCRGYFIVANTYQIASKLSFYLNEDVHALNYRSRKNQFDYWRFDLKRPIKDVCYISDNFEFTGEMVETPEGKRLVLVKGIPYEELLQRKAQSM